MVPLIIQGIGYVAGTLVTVANIPQVIKIYRMKEARDLSFYWLGLFTVGFVLWEIYGFGVSSFPLIITTAGTLLLVLIQCWLKMRYDRPKSKTVSSIIDSG